MDDSIMVMVDHGSTKGIILEPCHKTIDALGTAEIILNSLYKRYGLPDKAISDHGPQFASRVFKELGKLLGIKLAMSTAHHPQTDGASERANQEIEAYLSIFCGNNPETWKSPSNFCTTSNHTQPKRNHHCSYKWGITPHLSPPHSRLQIFLQLRNDYYYYKRQEKKPKQLMN